MIPRSHHLEADEIEHIADQNIEGRNALVAQCAVCRGKIRTALEGKKARNPNKLDEWARRYEAGKTVAMARGKDIDTGGRIAAGQWIIKISREIAESHAAIERILRESQKTIADYQEAMSEEDPPEWTAKTGECLNKIQQLGDLIFFLECKAGIKKVVGNHPESESAENAVTEAAA
ncbi:hypothetical protein HZA43_01430 [Candidatus Peregrinibacteria bacterium]|nr:hypothetical protein [Candidatus Peregrinibacteria bacterium]